MLEGSEIIGIAARLTVALITISSLVFVILLGVRYFREKKKKALRAREKEIEQALFVHLSHPLSNLEDLIKKTPKNTELLAKVLARLLPLLDEDSQDKLFQSFKHLCIPQWVYQELQADKMKRQIAACHLAVFFADKEIVSQLKVMLNDSRCCVRYAALEALCSIGDPAIFKEVAKALKKEELSYLLVSDLFLRFDSGIEKELISLLKSSKTPLPMKCAAVKNLGEIHSLASKKVIESHCKRTDPLLRQLCYEALYRLGLPVDLALIKRGQKDKNWKVRAAAAKCASSISPLPIETVAQFLEDPYWLVSLAAAKALYKQGSIGRNALSMLGQARSLIGRRSKAFLKELEELS